MFISIFFSRSEPAEKDDVITISTQPMKSWGEREKKKRKEKKKERKKKKQTSQWHGFDRLVPCLVGARPQVHSPFEGRIQVTLDGVLPGINRMTVLVSEHTPTRLTKPPGRLSHQSFVSG